MEFPALGRPDREHQREWLDSRVDRTIVALNVKSLSGTVPHEYLLSGLPDSERRNDGRLRDYWLRKYQHLEDGGWWCSGIDVLTGEDSEWGCFKPNSPRLNSKKEKTIKYEHPVRTKTGIFALRIPWGIGLKIAAKQGLKDEYEQRFWSIDRKTKSTESDSTRTESVNRVVSSQWLPTELGSENRPNSPLCTEDKARIGIPKSSLAFEDEDFWAWAIGQSKLKISIAEGAKKAGSLLTSGHCAIALPGVHNGYRQPKDETGSSVGFPFLIPELQAFCQSGREINFCFDRDTKPKTVRAVRLAIKRTGNLFKRSGCQVNIVRWQDNYKGVDDLIAAKGSQYFDRIYESRISLEAFNLEEFQTFTPDLTINERFFPDSLTLSDRIQLIGLKAPKGTGKTEFMARKLQPLLDRGERVLVVGHREQLMMELSRRFGVDYRTELRNSETEGVFGYALCIDSLHGKANPPFKPQDWEGAIVVIDELEQVLWHVLNGETCRQNRVRILNAFRELLQTVIASGGRLWVADADLTDSSIKYLKDLIGFPIPSYLVENVYQSNIQRECYVFEGNAPEQLITRLIDRLKAGEKPFILTDGQKHQSTWGTRNLEHYLKKQFPTLKILRIDRESVGDRHHPAFGCMGNLNEVLPLYDIAICSPTVETGVSIEVKHFSSVWAIAHGVQTIESVAQGLARIRDDVPRFIWAKDWSPNRIGGGAIELRTLLKTTHKLTSANIRLLTQAGFSEFDSLAFLEGDYRCSPSLIAWAKKACPINSQNRQFKNNLLQKLASEGYQILKTSEDKMMANSLKQSIKASRDELYGEYCQKIEEASNPCDSEYLSLKEKRSRSEDESIRLRKGKLCRRYLVEDTPVELIDKDDKGWFPKLQLHYYLNVGNAYLKPRDRSALREMQEQGDGQVFKPDLNKTQLSAKIEALKLIGIEQFFDREREFTSVALKDWLERVIRWRWQIKSLLGMSVNPDKDSAIGVAQRLLGLLGLKMKCLGEKTIDGKRVRVYRGCSLDPDGRQALFERWSRRDAELYGGDSIGEGLAARGEPLCGGTASHTPR